VKGGTVYFVIATVIMLAIVIVAMVVSGGFEMLQDSFGTAGVAGFIVLFALLSIGFVAMVQRSLRRAMQQGGTGGPSDQHDDPK
jgi:hypothetical protein